MSRVARKRSQMGIHHILVLGPRGQRIFDTDVKKQRYLETVQKYHYEGKVKLYAYCVLDNSAHLLIEEMEDTVSRFMRRVGISYVHWYNREYEREGPLFRERYTSNPVESETECIKIIRFIHQLPVRNGIVRRMSSYSWSSYNEYLEDSYRVDKGELLGQLGDWNYERYMQNNWQDLYLRERPPHYQKSDEEALFLIQKRLEGWQIEDLARMDKQERDHLLAQMRFEDGISIAQLSRITHIGKGIIQRIKPEKSSE